MKLSDKETLEYFHRSYTAVDGLWFVKVEEKYGFDTALDIDKKVWEVMPKIQSRFLKNKLKLDNGIKALIECFKVKLKLDSFKFKTEKLNEHKIKIIIHSCPWHNIMIKSGRIDLSKKVGSTICNTEYMIWAKEFGDNITFKLEKQICKGQGPCIIIFEEISKSRA
ncbi:hypothetical protein A2V94_03670 [Candidatus Atribacteria bacterium RBG_16_35_8]|nr:MAG: hypothetical protein A2V94_03670 [Candidatus Atribacteria bacterium RBG_16_35_8]